jgi:hypothetical protein
VSLYTDEVERARRLYGDRLIITGLELMYGSPVAEDFSGTVEFVRSHKIPRDYKIQDLERKFPELKDARNMLSHDEYVKVVRRIRPTLLNNLRKPRK